MKNILTGIVFILMCVHGLSQSSQIVVVIDPGHGGSDPGHSSEYPGHMAEKEINLIIAKQFGDQISSQLQNVSIVYTRTDDSYPSLSERVTIAHNQHADYFISIHCNASQCTKACGTETHVHMKSHTKAFALAKEIEKEFVQHTGRTSRGVKDTDDRDFSLHVLRETPSMTSVLVECGFLSNQAEGAFLNTPRGQQLSAEAIFNGFKRFIIREHPSITFLKTPEKTIASNTNNKEKQESTIKPTATSTQKSPQSSKTGGTSATTSKSVSAAIYTIQIMSSKQPVQTDHSEFKRIGMPVSRVEMNTTSSYKYLYTAGAYPTKEAALKDLEMVQKNGFKDAYIVPKKSSAN